MLSRVIRDVLKYSPWVIGPFPVKIPAIEQQSSSGFCNAPNRRLIEYPQKEMTTVWLEVMVGFLNLDKIYRMKEQLVTLLTKLRDNSLPFKEVIEFIETYYHHQPTAFKNGSLHNEATQNQGSAKAFTFAHLNNLNKEDTLYLFAEHYQSVLKNPDGTDHQNIRQFMIHGWPGIIFEGQALVAK